MRTDRRICTPLVGDVIGGDVASFQAAEGRRVTEAGGERGHTRRHGHKGHKKQKGHKGQKQGARPLVHDKVIGTGPAA